MSEPEILENISTLQRWLAAAWRRLGDPALTAFDKRELRNQMKQADTALRKCLALATELKAGAKGAKPGAKRETVAYFRASCAPRLAHGCASLADRVHDLAPRHGGLRGPPHLAFSISCKPNCGAP